MASYGQSVSSLAISMAQNDNSIDEINAALTKAVKGTHPEGQDPALGILIAWGNLTGIPLDVFLTQQEMTPEKAAEILSNTPTTTEAKTLQFVAAKVYLAFAKSGKEIPSWDAGIGQYRFKNTGKVIDVEHPNGKFNGNSLPYKNTVGKIEPKNYVDILSPEAKQHILYGDNLKSGGHIFPGNPGKATFPSNWPSEKIIHEFGDITTSPTTQWYAQTGGTFTSKGKPARWVAYEERDGVRIRVVYLPSTGKVVTAFPDPNPVPKAYKPIK
ncbi:EndoU domain-containing protein [Proteus cibi]|uniref:EndoU domain-containing protein n=1 Tax=Proteus cibi TaxID=2050966 RepID=UPI002B218ECB|nr:EndoU domain-containing protein [Proteus cibi]